MLGTLLKPLDGHASLHTVESSRGFLTITGQWKGFPVSIVTHLMGFGNLDLFLRETRAVTDPPLLVIRVGTCGSLNNRVGQLHVPSKGSVAILRNPDAFVPSVGNGSGVSPEPYSIVQPCYPDEALTDAFLREARALLGGDRTLMTPPFTIELQSLSFPRQGHVP
jgi:uridine phosphorylase